MHYVSVSLFARACVSKSMYVCSLVIQQSSRTSAEVPLCRADRSADGWRQAELVGPLAHTECTTAGHALHQPHSPVAHDSDITLSTLLIRTWLKSTLTNRQSSMFVFICTHAPTSLKIHPCH